MSATPGHWLAIVAKTTSSRTNEKCCLKKQDGKPQRKLLSIGICTHVHVYIHI